MTSLSISTLIPSLIGFALPTRLRISFVQRLLRHITRGRLTVQLPDGSRLTVVGEVPGTEAELRIIKWSAVNRLLIGGDIGFAEAYVDGDWDSPDLVAFLTLCGENLDALNGLAEASLPMRIVQRLMMLTHRNSKSGSRRNIMAHYDLGNAFFAEWLDREMIYSSALYEPGDDLETAQRRKLDKIAELVKLDGRQSVLEIGCGWGRLAAHLAGNGARMVEGVTLSPAQLEAARERVTSFGEQVSLSLTDYRDITGTYDRIVSIEMFEAVGEAYWAGYFDKLREVMPDDGRAVVQVISIADDSFEHYRSHPDMIQTMVFPGGMLPSKSVFAETARQSKLAVRERFDFGLSYAETLADWRRRFDAAWPKITALGYSQTFRRLWSYYLAYCEAGFRTGRIDVSLYVLTPMPERP